MEEATRKKKINRSGGSGNYKGNSLQEEMYEIEKGREM